MLILLMMVIYMVCDGECRRADKHVGGLTAVVRGMSEVYFW